jgi:hypothetical protein
VRIRFGARDVVAEVVEDRGRLGRGGEQIVRVAVPMDGTDHVELEVTASMASPVEPPPRRAKAARPGS